MPDKIGKVVQVIGPVVDIKFIQRYSYKFRRANISCRS